jgi:hypothetical protein
MGMVEIECFGSLFLPAGRQGRWGQNPAFSNGVYGNIIIFESSFRNILFGNPSMMGRNSIVPAGMLQKILECGLP